MTGGYILPTYARYDVCFTRGEGARLYDEGGREYIDFASGIGVNSVGHAHAAWVSAVSAQAAALAHVSNLYLTRPGAVLAERLCALAGLEAVFFANSGAEANEGMVKCARKYGAGKREGRNVIVALENSFHGRTVTTLAATGQEAFHRHFHPFTPGFRHVPLGDINALAAQPDDVCAVLLELVQGEGGVIEADRGYARAVARLCAERDWLLCVDEVQTGIGRCGAWFAFQLYGIAPDIVSFAKGIAGGLPLGGFICGKKTAATLEKGDHASTFGMNPVCCAAANAVLDILAPVLPDVPRKGEYIKSKLSAMGLSPRGLGLMLAAKAENPKETAARLLERGLAVLTAGKDALRFLPPLTIEYNEIDKGLDILRETLAETR
ncbi:MAG: acetylornithine/succinylornithine family transaminase [Oscillospiraceae bacterium]|jgi:acetylornithine/N-succinyldiaminopimelate aminotransferase|nr:acetylornithine/succinylornithine family transaminase [Oscillospiraceae bacterium]